MLCRAEQLHIEATSTGGPTASCEGHRLHLAVVMAQGLCTLGRIIGSQKSMPQDHFIVHGFNMELVPEEARELGKST